MDSTAPSCDIRLTNALVVTMDERGTTFDSGEVCVTGDTIVAVGKGTGYTSRETVDCGGRVVMPGLVNAHTHVPMTLMRGLADDLKLDVWLMGYMMPVEREFVNPDFVRLGTGLACAEMIRSGVTCFADMYYYEAAVAETAAAAGVRALCGQTVLKFPSPDAASFEDSLALAREFVRAWKGHPLVVPAVAPHAPYTTTPEILRASAELAAEFDVPIHIHLSETALEVEDSRKAHGMPVVPWVKKQQLFEAKVLAAHCVHVDEGEMRTLKHAGCGIAHNPTSNLKLGAGVAPVAKMLEAGLAVGIGTDGAASNNDLDMFEETRLAAVLAKGIGGDPTALPARQALAMATRLGARALHLQAITGSLEPGKRADLITVDLGGVHARPRFARDPQAVYSQIVYAGKSTDVVDVMCNGRWLMRGRELLTVDEPALLEAAAGYARRIDAFLLTREQSLLSKLLAIGGATEEESFEVQVKARLSSAEPVLRVLDAHTIPVKRSTHYRQYDTYFLFGDATGERVRYREDEVLDEDDQVARVRARLTLMGPSYERQFGQVVLSRSRYLAPATYSLRFYREYFRPREERQVQKERRRWTVTYKGFDFYINLDRLVVPPLDGYFLEVKSRTWSRRDAEEKAAIVDELLALLGASPGQEVDDYVALVERGA
jgi:5-methylthioadenosine/S-adenosylhomocysteine deaminase